MPADQCAANVAWRLFTGFLFWPPRLWRAASVLFTSNIFMRSKDSKGFHKVWPRWTEAIAAVMIIAQGLAIFVGMMWLMPRAKVVYQATTELLHAAVHEAHSLKDE